MPMGMGIGRIKIKLVGMVMGIKEGKVRCRVMVARGRRIKGISIGRLSRLIFWIRRKIVEILPQKSWKYLNERSKGILIIIGAQIIFITFKQIVIEIKAKWSEKAIAIKHLIQAHRVYRIKIITPDKLTKNQLIKHRYLVGCH